MTGVFELPAACATLKQQAIRHRTPMGGRQDFQKLTKVSNIKSTKGKQLWWQLEQVVVLEESTSLHVRLVDWCGREE